MESGFWRVLLEETQQLVPPLENGSPGVLWGVWSWSSIGRLLCGAGREVRHGYRMLLLVLLFVLGQGRSHIRWVEGCYPGREDSRAVGSCLTVVMKEISEREKTRLRDSRSNHCRSAGNRPHLTQMRMRPALLYVKRKTDVLWWDTLGTTKIQTQLNSMSSQWLFECIVLRANVNIFTARSVYLMTSTPDGGERKRWWKEIRWEVTTHPDINRPLDIID